MEEDNQEPVVIETPRFMAVVWGAGGQGDGPTTIVQLDGHGAGARVGMGLLHARLGLYILFGVLALRMLLSFWSITRQTVGHMTAPTPDACCLLLRVACCCHLFVRLHAAAAGNLKDLMTAAQLSGNVPRTVNSSADRERPVFDPAADPKKSKDSQKIREKVSVGARHS